MSGAHSWCDFFYLILPNLHDIFNSGLKLEFYIKKKTYRVHTAKSVKYSNLSIQNKIFH